MTGDTIRQTVVVTNSAGFHMRPMQAFVETAIRFPTCTVSVARPDKPPANGKSMLGLMGLAADEGTELVIEVAGPGAADVLQELVLVFQRSYEPD